MIFFPPSFRFYASSFFLFPSPLSFCTSRGHKDRIVQDQRGQDPTIAEHGEDGRERDLLVNKRGLSMVVQKMDVRVPFRSVPTSLWSARSTRHKKYETVEVEQMQPKSSWILKFVEQDSSVSKAGMKLAGSQ
ncbi:hypothetical protein PV05_11518, partial [Exophiala xenobiotica]